MTKDMFDTIPPYYGFTVSPPVVPSLYWNVYSQEQRIKEICKELLKCIRYAESIGTETNDIAEKVQDIYDGKLDTEITAVIAEWFEEHEPELTEEVRELSETVGQLSETVGQLSDDLTALDTSTNTRFGEVDTRIDGADDNITALQQSVIAIREDMYQPKGLKLTVLNIVGSCTVAEPDDGTIVVFDCGATQDAVAINNWFSTHGIERIDALIITHYHWDHAAGYNGLTNFIDSDTDIYVQMPVPSTNDEYETYSQYYGEIVLWCSTNNFKTPVTPVNNSTVMYNETTLRFLNTDPAYVSIYENAWANSGSFDTQVNGLNNYSVVTELTYGNSNFYQTGDIEGAAQKVLEPLIDSATVAWVPHHLSNYMGWYRFFDKMNPVFWLVNIGGQDPTTTEINVFSLYLCYSFKYIKFRNATPIISNKGEDAVITIVDGYCRNDGGTPIMPNYSGNYTAYMMLPPTFYDDNPYILRQISLKDLVTLSDDFPYTFTCYAGATSEFFSNSTFFQELNEVFAITYPNDNVYRFTVGGTHLIASINTSYGPYNTAEIYNDFDITENKGYRLFDHSTEPKMMVVFGTAKGSGDSFADELTTAQTRAIMHAHKIGMRVAGTNTWVTLSEMMPNNATPFATPNKWYCGLAPSTVNPNVIRIVMTQSTTLGKAVSIDLLNPAVNDITMDAIAIFE